MLQLYSDLLTGDQLVLEQSAGNVFQGFREGAITFPPTYKYDLFRYLAHVSGVQCCSLFCSLFQRRLRHVREVPRARLHRPRALHAPHARGTAAPGLGRRGHRDLQPGRAQGIS